MSCFHTRVIRKETADLPKVVKVPLPEGKGGIGMSWARFADPQRDSDLFERRWFDEYRAFVRRGYRQRDFFAHYNPAPEAA